MTRNFWGQFVEMTAFAAARRLHRRSRQCSVFDPILGEIVEVTGHGSRRQSLEEVPAASHPRQLTGYTKTCIDGDGVIVSRCDDVSEWPTSRCCGSGAREATS